MKKINIIFLICLICLIGLATASIPKIDYVKPTSFQVVAMNDTASDFWDSLDSPSDILVSSLNNNLNWINNSQETDQVWLSEKGDYFTSSEVLGFSYYNSTSFPDNYLFNTGDTATGNYTFGSGTLYIDSSGKKIGVKKVPYYEFDITGDVGMNTIDKATSSSSYSTFRSGTSQILSSKATDEVTFSNNLYYNGTGWFYGVSDYASRITQYNGQIIIDVLPSRSSNTAVGSTYTRAVVIDNNGRLGVNNLYPSSTIDVKGNARFGADDEQVFQITNDSANKQIITSISQRATNQIPYNILYRSYGISSNTNVLFLNMSSGNIGIGGVSSPSDKLTIIGNVNISGCYELSNGTIIGGACVSDERLKENIQDYKNNFSKLEQLNVKTFEWKDSSKIIGEEEYTYCYEDIIQNETIECYEDICNLISPKITNTICKNETKDITMEFPNGTQKGFIAQEVEEVYPDRVIEENGIKKVIYGWDWIFDLWAFASKHEERIKKLESENELIKQELCTYNPASKLCR